MNKNILIILVLILIIMYVCFSDKIEKFTQNIRLSNIYSASNLRAKKDEAYNINVDDDNKEIFTYKNNTFKLEDELYNIGIDDNNEDVFEFKNNTFKLGDDDSFQPYEPKKVKYSPVAVRIPHVETSKSIKSKVPMKVDGYKFKGLLSNPYYKQFYVTYEKEYTNYQREDKLYEYLLVKKIEDQFKIIYNIPPRSNIEVGDTIYFSYGNFQLGPLKFI